MFAIPSFTFRLIQHFKRVVLKTRGKILERQLEFQLRESAFACNRKRA